MGEFDRLAEQLSKPLPSYLARGFLEALGTGLAAAKQADPARFEEHLAPTIAAFDWPDPLPLEGVEAVTAWESIREGASYSLAFGGPQPADLMDQLVATGAGDRIAAVGFIGAAEDGTSITDALLASIAGCTELSGLRQIALRGALYRGGPSKLDGSGLRALAASSHAERLTSLWVEEIAGPRDVLFESLAAWRALTWLKLARLELTADELGSLTQQNAWPNLETLEIAACPIGDEGAVHIAAADWKLTKLYLHHTKIEGPGVEALAASEHLAGLTVLELPNNWLTDAGALATANAGWKLTELDLTRCQIREAGFVALAGAPFIGDLTAFAISNNSPWDKGVEAMESSPLARLFAQDIRHDFDND